MHYTSSSSFISLFVNFKIEHVFTPWKIIVDINNEIITVEKRNWFLIGKDYDTIAFRFIRRVIIKEHLFGSDITISVFGNSITAYYIPKKKCKDD